VQQQLVVVAIHMLVVVAAVAVVEMHIVDGTYLHHVAVDDA